MGGIAGLIHFRGPAPERAVGEAMSAAVAHRGPDDAGLWTEGPALLAHRRLSLAHAGRAHPLHAPPLHLAVDGRLYDTANLRRELADHGLEPETRGAGDHFLAAWRIWGPDALSHVRGDFALACWDSRDHVLHLARDRVGIRPLYYAHQDGRFAFASDVRALLLLPWVSRELAHEELAEFLSFRYVHAPRTLLRDVRQLPAGHLARVDATGVRTFRWWTPGFCPPDEPVPSDEEVDERLDTLLDRAVDRCLVADKPVALLLSGGTDSAAIAAATARKREVTAYTVALSGSGASEAAFAGRVAKLLGLNHEVLRIDRDAIEWGVSQVVEAMGQPVTSPSAIPFHLLAREVREDNAVALSGHGGDHVLGGSRTARLVQELRGASLIGRMPPSALDRARTMAGRFKSYLSAPESYGLERGLGGSDVFDVDERMSLLRDPAHVRPGLRSSVLEPLYNEVSSDPINEVLHVYFRGWLAEDDLLRADRVCMAVGLEARFPLLDNDLLACTASLPGRAKIKRRRGRWYPKFPLKRLLERQLPSQIVWRPKRGSPIRLNSWLRGEGERFLWDRIDAVCEDPLGLFRTDHVRDLARAHARGDADHGARLWSLIFFDLWWRRLQT